MESGVFGAVNKESIDEAYRNGLVKPNEYESIRDNLIAREIFLRSESLSKRTDYFLLTLKRFPVLNSFYLKKTGFISAKEAIIHLAYNEPDELLIDEEDISTLILSDVAFNKATRVRDLGDLNRSRHIEGNIFADKETIRSLEYLIRYKRGLWDLLECLNEEMK